MLSSNEALRKKSIKGTDAIIVFKLTNKDKKSQFWYLDLKQAGEVGKGDKDKADVTLSMSDADFGALVAGKANAQRLFMSGKLKAQGNIMKATTIEGVLKSAKASL